MKDPIVIEFASEPNVDSRTRRKPGKMGDTRRQDDLLQVLIKLLLDGLKLFVCIADVQDEGINPPTDNPGN